jgi:hypothetical protein
MSTRPGYSTRRAIFMTALSLQRAKLCWRRAAIFLLAAGALSVFFVYGNSPQVSGSSGKETASLSEEQVQAEKIIPAPKNVKERTTVTVFLIWLWAAIFALVYILRLKIQESDRIKRLRFFSNEKK